MLKKNRANLAFFEGYVLPAKLNININKHSFTIDYIIIIIISAVNYPLLNTGLNVLFLKTKTFYKHIFIRVFCPCLSN